MNNRVYSRVNKNHQLQYGQYEEGDQLEGDKDKELDHRLRQLNHRHSQGNRLCSHRYNQRRKQDHQRCRSLSSLYKGVS